MKLNKGVRGEPSVALRLLGDGRLQMADGSGGCSTQLLERLERTAASSANRCNSANRYRSAQ